MKFDVGIMKRLFFVLGDVVAFYPNIDIQKAHKIASGYLIDYYSSFGEDFDFNWVK